MAPNLLPTFWTLFGFIFQQGELRRDISCWRVPNRLGGMRDLAIFRGDIRDLSRKHGREAGISVASGSGKRIFGGLGCGIGKQRSGIRDFNSNVTSYQRKNRKLAEMNLLYV